MLKISFLASHRGSAAKYLIHAMQQGQLQAETAIVITNNRDSEIYLWCIENKIDVHCINSQTHLDEDEKDEAIRQLLHQADTGLVILSGYMKKIGPRTIKQFANKILNIHPSLLPRHGGQGLYGDKAHQAVLQSGDQQSGASVQFINEEYDQGPVIMQRTVDIDVGETVASLKSKVQAIEAELYLDSIKQIMKTIR